jgi:hypothetical protein
MSIFSTILADLESEWAKLFGTTGAEISAAVLADIKMIGSGLTGALAEFEAVTGLDAAVVLKIQTDIGAIETAALSVATTVATDIAKPIVTQIADDFAELQTVLATVSIPAAVENILKAVSVLLPYIEAGVGILTAATVGAAEAAGMSADDARAVLTSAAA